MAVLRHILFFSEGVVWDRLRSVVLKEIAALRDQPRMVYSANSRLEESESEFSADDAVDDSCDSSEDEVSPSNRPRNRMIEIDNHSRKNVHTESSGKQARSSSAKRGSKGKKGTKGKK
ncbi:hypothetical protein WA588_006289, partial [Blastocystis sp. NMH]